MRATLIGLLLLAGCAKPEPRTEIPASYCELRIFEGSRFTVCDNQGGEFLLLAASKKEAPLRSFAEVARHVDAKRVAFAMNAGMFDQAGRPIGLAETNGVEVHKLNTRSGGGNFHMKPNGVFVILASGRAAIFPSDSLPRFPAPPRLATQSGPMLVIADQLHPAFDRDGRSRYVRNGVGVTADGKALFVISTDPVSFGKLARFFRDGLKTPNALFFDGVVSSLWDPANYRMDSHAQLGPIIVALKPAPRPPRPAPRSRTARCGG
ncbi:MAG TPA: phosphodiester glycosidase family protein [Sphingomicrobium sp.]